MGGREGERGTPEEAELRPHVRDKVTNKKESTRAKFKYKATVEAVMMSLSLGGPSDSGAQRHVRNSVCYSRSIEIRRLEFVLQNPTRCDVTRGGQKLFQVLQSAVGCLFAIQRDERAVFWDCTWFIGQLDV